MIAKIGKGMNIFGAVSYNQHKVDKENGKVLRAHKIPEPVDGNFTVAKICRAFDPYLIANNKTEKPVRHISLNPDPSDKVSDDRFIKMAEQYMKEMGYSSQPYIVYKHTDIERTHIHIVTTCVLLDGSKIPDSYDHHRSMAACRNLEKAFGLKPADEKTPQHEKPIFKPVEYLKGNVKSQMAAVIRYLPKYYSFPNLGTYNALLSLLNITAEPISGEANGIAKKGLLYFALDANCEKTGKPFKSSLFGKHAGLESLEMHFEKSKIVMDKHPAKTILKNSIEAAMQMANGESNFKRQLLEQGVNVVVRRNNEGRVYGITYIDHESRSVWNGSQLAKNLSANVFNDWWNNGTKIDSDIAQSTKLTPSTVSSDEKAPFEFLTHSRNDSIFEVLGSLLPDSQGEDYEELDFENRMKKKKKYRRGQS
ncbi:conjugal transfer protein MobB [Flavobacterium rakeshii]|uniref:conjugal transfer protein MobB n=1 Tax=Flavobacterium rakeshii TaxID=1038845 RepID=UPI002E7AF061|nr:conjugal transfer protein MobB [Flavobacterium rakeshii]MEE1897009.1 conjugal transfer protein MobB [Flavobacterium rakeshii]